MFCNNGSSNSMKCEYTCPDQEKQKVRKGMKGKMIVRNRVEERGVSSKGSIEYKLMNMCINSKECIADMTRHGKVVQ